jgi:hypothetical protein
MSICKVATVLASVLVCATVQASTTVISDIFNDNSRDRTIWGAFNYNIYTRLAETGGRLYYRNGGYDFAGTYWYTKHARVMINDDTLDASAFINVPAGSLPNNSSSGYLTMGLTWHEYENYLNLIRFSVKKTPAGRTLLIDANGYDHEFAYPTSGGVFLRMKVLNNTDKLTFWWRAPGESVWHKVPYSLNLATEWAEPGNTVAIIMQLYASSEHYSIQPGNGVYFDDFRAAHNMPW